MALLTSLALFGGAVAAGIAATRPKPKPTRLVDAFIGGEPKAATLLQTAKPGAIAQAQQLMLDLFGDTRQQQQQALNTTYDATVEQKAEQVQKQNLLVAVSGLGLATMGTLLAPIFYVPSIGCTLYAFRQFYRDGWHSLWQERRVDYLVIYPLMATVALLGGFIWAAAFAAIFSMLNRVLITRTESRSKANIADLFGGQIHTVWLLVDGVETETPFAQVQAGDIVVVHAGQPIPVDGIVVHGGATIDQRMLTGESQPVEKGPDDMVLAPTLLLSGFIHVRVEKAGEATVAAQIGQMLSQTTDFKQVLQSRTERLLNRMILPLLAISAVAFPTIGLSGAIAIIWYYPGARMMFFGPLSMLSYLQVAAQKGILVKDGRALEVLDEVDTVVFDKTGTLTLEEPTVSRIICCNGLAEAELLRYAAAAEAKQSHPIARAILRAATEHGLDLPPLEDAQYKVGYGLKTQIAGQITRVGSVRFMMMEGIAVPPEIAAQQAESHAQGHSLVLVALGHELAGAIDLQPTIRPEAREIVHCLHERGIETVIISGDNDEPTQHLAGELGIDRYFAEVLPEEKAKLVTQLQGEGHKVCFVGDGINDSIALKTADVAVSLRGATTVATDMAEIVFMDGTLGQLPTLFELADDFAANMRINMLAATLPGVVGIAGTLLFGWGMTLSVFLSQANIPIGVYNSLKPLLDQQKNYAKLNAHQDS